MVKKPVFENGKIKVRRSCRADLPYGQSVENFIEGLEHIATDRGVSLSEIFIDFSYEMGYYNNPELYIELQWMSLETDKEWNKRIETEKKKNILDAENKRKSQEAEAALYLKLKKKYELS